MPTFVLTKVLFPVVCFISIGFLTCTTAHGHKSLTFGSYGVKVNVGIIAIYVPVFALQPQTGY